MRAGSETTAGLAICIEERTGVHLAREGIYKMPRRVLIADDSPLARKTLQDLLQTHGWEVCGQAENGVDAVTMVAELDPDVVILDLAMPSMDGLTAARQISESLPTIPIVMHTLHNLPQLELEAKKNGVRCIVPKSESGSIIAVLEELTSASSPQNAGEMEPATTKTANFAARENTVGEPQAAESASQAESRGDIGKAS